MASFNKINGFMYHSWTKKHDPVNDTYSLLLSNTAPSSESTDPTLLQANCYGTNVTEIANAGNADSLNLITGLSQTDDSAAWTITDKTFIASTGTVGPFQYIYVKNNSTDALVCYFDIGTEVILTTGQAHIVMFPENLLTGQEVVA